MNKYSDKQLSAAQSARALARSSLTLSFSSNKSTSKSKLLVEVCQSRPWHIFMVFMIIFNSVLVVSQTDARARGDDIPAWQDHATGVMLLLFVFETATRIYMEKRAYFLESFNIAEFVILSIDVVLEIYSWLVKDSMSVAYFRLMRIARFFRILRMLSGFRELFMMLHGMQSAMKAMMWSLVMVAVVLAMWSIIGVEFIRDLDHKLFNDNKYRAGCFRCGQAFDSVWETALTLMSSTIAGDGWGTIAVPMMLAYPASSIFFCGTFMMINLGLLNLIMAVIVDRAQEARREDETHVLIEKSKDFTHSRNRFLELCYTLDTDRNGTISVEELRRGADESPEFSDILRLMDITDDDLEVLFAFLDVDGSGNVDYSEFIRQLYKLRTVDSHTALLLMGERISKIYDKMEIQIGMLRKAVISVEESMTCATAGMFLAHQATDETYALAPESPRGPHSTTPSDLLASVRCNPDSECPPLYESSVRESLRERCEHWMNSLQTHLDQFQQTLLAHNSMFAQIYENPSTSMFPSVTCASDAVAIQRIPTRTSGSHKACQLSHTGAPKQHGFNLSIDQLELRILEATAATQASTAHTAFEGDGKNSTMPIGPEEHKTTCGV